MKKIFTICLLMCSILAFTQSKPVVLKILPPPTKGNLSLLNRDEAKMLLLQVNQDIVSDTLDNPETLALQKQIKDFLRSKGKTNTIKDVPAKYVDKLLGNFENDIKQFESSKIMLERKWGILEEWMKTDTALRIFDDNLGQKPEIRKWINRKKNE